VIALAIVSTAGFVIINLVMDLLYPVIDRACRVSAHERLSQPARRAIKKPKGLLLPLALLVVAILGRFRSAARPDRAARSDCARHGGPAEAAEPDTHLRHRRGRPRCLSRIVYGTRYSLGVAIVIVFAPLCSASSTRPYPAWRGVHRQSDDAHRRSVLRFSGAGSGARRRPPRSGVASTRALSLAIIWCLACRVVLGEVLRLREPAHVERARAAGVSDDTCRRTSSPRLQMNVRVTTTSARAGRRHAVVPPRSRRQFADTEWGLLIRDSRSYFGSAWWYLSFRQPMHLLRSLLRGVGDALARGARRMIHRSADFSIGFQREAKALSRSMGFFDVQEGGPSSSSASPVGKSLTGMSSAGLQPQTLCLRLDPACKTARCYAAPMPSCASARPEIG